MVKERLNTIDVAISVANLKKMVTNLTLVNIYDITNRVFILKFSKNETKIYVLVEIGSRIHATQFLRSVDHLPSNFNAKLRKHLRNRRLRDVSQMCQDRIIDFTFSSEEYAHHLIVQLFLPGNIYLTDHEYKVMTVLKPKNTGDKFFKVGTNYVFDMEYNSWFEPVKKPLVEEALGNKKITDVVKDVFPSIHNSFITSVLGLKFKAEGKEDVKKELEKRYSNEDLESAYELVEYVRKYLENLLNRKDKIPGYVYKNAKGEMEDFGIFEEPNSEHYEDFNDAVDAFFTKNELVKQEKKTVDKKPTKISKIKIDQDKREKKLMDEIKKYDKEIEILENNIDIAENCLNLTKALIASGASWNDIYEQLQIQRRENHPLVKYIKDINIPNQTLSFLDETEGEKEGVVVLDYRLNGHQNLKDLYNKRKKSENKLERTKIGKEYALKKVTKSMSKQKEEKKQSRKSREVRISSLRKKFWFEKFYWFITSQGYLVLAGRDALQNEILVKKYLTKGDLYLHADIHGASSVILKMKMTEKSRSENEIKETEETEEFITQMRMSIEEAGTFATCHSNAWNEKFLVQSWWVYWHQVSKTPPTGEYVSQGSFVIRGKKNYIMPQKLEMGITYLFQVQPFQSLDTKEELEELKPEGVQNENEQTPGEEMEEDGVEDANDIEEDDELEEECEEDEEDQLDDENGENELGEEDEEDALEDLDEDDDDNELEEDDEDEELDDEYDDDEEEDEEEPEEDEDCEDGEEEDEEESDEVDDENDQKLEEKEEDEEEVKTVQIGNVETISEYEANIQKRTRGRLATGHPNKAKLNNLRNQLNQLNLNSPPKEVTMLNEAEDDEDDESGRTVKIQEPEKMQHTEEALRKIRQRQATCIIPNTQKINNMLKNNNLNEDDESDEERTVTIQEPEKVQHTEEALRKIRQRQATCIIPNTQKINNMLKNNNLKDDDEEEDNKNKSKVVFKKEDKAGLKKEVKEDGKKKVTTRMIRFINQKVRRMRKKYGQDDEETQEIRRQLMGSKKLKEKKGKLEFSKDLVGVKEEREKKFKDKEKEIDTIDDRELENYMKQLSCLSKEVKEDDDVINVIPMCAPYSAVRHYKNSLKLVPGNAKKGTIATQSLQYFMKNDPGNAHYLKMITTDQLTLTLIGNCKFANLKN